ncbi:FAD/FMN-dependent dehydrogenase [Thecamonas trahens ATCC 50062]|uniref:FAD/FMN-dependent dehydrogenase n=1 Tax=Thecamonas trahens ATCC 50062 TaxID=461836 RepID=A0A0L0D9Q6_THETB|nr:FAD/FMN-dependent dehydrogenase [Thecamonas trahens ATCC 50062]KNC48821.1 FAD/FMN-dependent dehydrogenase [Thecamonas trahens ATCC 50062]|eukprot:XP_013758241.1 FAD/FMN-dependent dehydrogenase [Thecamonas trahens ATCC 50062]
MAEAELAERVLRKLHETGCKVVTAHGSEYDGYRRVWNAAVDVRPACVVVPQSADEVAAVVSALWSLGVAVTVRGGGHSVRGLCVAEGSVCIDLRELVDVKIGSSGPGTVLVGGGATWADVDRVLEPHGVTVPAGLISHTGVGGLALGGGVGWLARRAGLTADAIVGAQMVLVGGDVVGLGVLEHTGDETEPEIPRDELLWALQGGGGNFGIVTQFAFSTVQLGKAGLVMVTLPMESLAGVLRLVAGWVDPHSSEAAPDTVVPYTFVLSQGVVLVAIGCMDDGVAARGLASASLGRYVGALIELGGELTLDTVVSPRELNAMFDAGNPHGKHYRWSASTFLDTGCVTASADAFATGLAELASTAAQYLVGATASIELVPLGGAVARVADGETAWPLRSAGLEMHGIATWEESAESDKLSGAARAWAHRVAQHAETVAYNREAPQGYANTDGDESGARWRSGPSGRLAAIKNEVDMHNFWHGNHNVLPTHSRTWIRLSADDIAAADAGIDAELEAFDALDAEHAEGGAGPQRLETLWLPWMLLHLGVVGSIASVLWATGTLRM